MVQSLRVLNALPEDQGLGPGTHWAAHRPLKLQFQGILCSFWASSAMGIHMASTDRQMVLALSS